MSNQTQAWDTAYEWKAVSLLTFGFGLVGLDRWIIAPMFPAIAPDLHLNYQDLGNIIGALGMAWGISAIVLGGLSDRIGRKAVLVPAIVLFSLLSSFSGMAGGLVSLLLVRGVMGVTEGAFCPTSFAATADASKPARRGLNQGIQQSTFALFGLAFAPLIATQLLHLMSWRWVFVMVAIPGLITAGLLAVVIREPRGLVRTQSHKAQGGHVRRAPLTDMFKHRNVPLGMLSLLCAMTGIFVLSALTPNYLTDYLKLPNAQMGFVISAIGFGGFFGQFGLPGLSDLFGRRFMALTGFVGGAVFLWAFIHTGANPPVLFALLFGTTLFAFGLFALITGPIATEAAPEGLISSAAGLIIGTGEIFGGGIAPSLAGMIAQRNGIQYVPYLALGGLVLGAVISLFSEGNGTAQDGGSSPRRAQFTTAMRLEAMSNADSPRTVFGSLDSYVKGDLEIIHDNPKYYAFSNVFDVAAKSKPYEKVIVALNLGYVLETLRAEGVSDWFACSHDEFAIILDGTVEIDLVKLDNPTGVMPADKKGAIKLSGAPVGRKMGHIKASRGHQALLPAGAAYRFTAAKPGVILLQSIEGDLSIQKWAEICYT